MYIYIYILGAKWGAKTPHFARLSDLRKKGTVRNTELKPRNTVRKPTISERRPRNNELKPGTSELKPNNTELEPRTSAV